MHAISHHRRIAIVCSFLVLIVLISLPSSVSLHAQGEVAANSQIYLPMIQGTPNGNFLNGRFLETFDGDPTVPTPWNPPYWDVAVHSRDASTWYQLETMQASHGADCAGPPATHTITNYEDAVFTCRNHIMTSLQAAGYGEIFLTPSYMVDFTDETAIIRFDMSTMRTTQRDWVDIWITPFEDNIVFPLDLVVDLSGPPQNAIHFTMDIARSAFTARVYKDFKLTYVGSQFAGIDYDSFLEPDAARRDVFEMRISRDHLMIGMPAYNFWWVDAPMESLDWTRGVVQFGHHSYNPLKDCPSCRANTWHWDNVVIDPAVPFTMIKANQRYATSSKNTSITLARTTPENAFLRFSGIGDKIEVSFDGGKTWQNAQVQAQDSSFFKDEHFRSYWMPVPKGIRSIQFRGQKWWGGDWFVRDPSVWVPPAE